MLYIYNSIFWVCFIYQKLQQTQLFMTVICLILTKWIVYFEDIFRNLLLESIFWGFLSVAKNCLGRSRIPNSADPYLLICQVHLLGYFITKLMETPLSFQGWKMSLPQYWRCLAALYFISISSWRKGKNLCDIHRFTTVFCIRCNILNAKANICSCCQWDHNLHRAVNMDTFNVIDFLIACGDITVVTIVKNVCNNVLAIIAT